jgi:hypothetical protein
MAPDLELLRSAADRSLLSESVLEAHYRRLTASPLAARARTLQYLEWLHLENLASAWLGDEVEPWLAPDLLQQTSLFISELLAQPEAPLGQLLSSSRQPLNQRLAEHYGIDADVGADFAFVELDPNLYAGVLGQGAMLTLFRWPSQRGMFIQERLLGNDIPEPPVDHLWDQTGWIGETPREKTSNATSQQAICKACHDLMDPMGFALDAFDELGRLTGFDSSGTLRTIDGTSTAVANPAELGKAIANSHAGRLGAVRGHLEHLLDRSLRSNDDPLAECLAGAFVDGKVELHELARQVGLSAAVRTMTRSPTSLTASSNAADPLEHAIAESITLLPAFPDLSDRVLLEQYVDALRNLQQMPSF